jgi:hypothetical protein
MGFSFADLGYWRLAIVTFTFEVLHLLLLGRWPEIRGSRLGPRPSSAIAFMFLESIVLLMTMAAAIGTVSRQFELKVRPKRKVFSVVFSAVVLLGMFLLVWEY